MTQSAFRLLVGGLVTASLFANLARGDDKVTPEILPSLKCVACEVNATSGSKIPDFSKLWTSKSLPVVSNQIMSVGTEKLSSSFPVSEDRDYFARGHRRIDDSKEIKSQVAALMKQYQALYRAHKYAEAEEAAKKAQELDPDNYVIGAAIQSAHITTAKNEYADRESTNTLRRTHGSNSLEPVNSPCRSENEREINRRLDGPTENTFRGHLASILKLCNAHYDSQRRAEKEQSAKNAAKLLEANKKLRENSQAEIAAKKSQELDPDNYVISSIVSARKAPVKNKAAVSESENAFRRTFGSNSPKAVNSPYRSENEREINRRLDGPVTAFDYHETPLQQILDDLASWSQIDIVPDVPALKAAKISLTQPISLKLEGASLKTALRLLLEPAKLTYSVENYALVITTPDSRIGTFECKVYPVADLLKMTTVPLEVMSFQRDSIQSPEKRLINLLQRTIEPESWSSVGGPGVIEYFPQGKALVVRHLPDAQNQISELLDAFRRELGQQKAAVAENERRSVAPPVGSVFLSQNGLKLLGVDFATESIGHPHLPPPVPTLRNSPTVNCPVNIPVQPWTFIGGGPPLLPPEKISLLSPFMPPEPTFRDPAIPKNHDAFAQLQTFDVEGDVLIQTGGTETAQSQSGTCWVIRSHAEEEKSTFSAQSQTASMECERLSIKGKHDISLEFVAGRKTVHVRGKDFEAEAESIEFREQDGKLVLDGHAKLSTRVKEDTPTVVNAARIVLDCQSHDLQAYGMGSATKSK